MRIDPHPGMQRPIEYRDRRDRVWYVSEAGVVKVVSPAIDGPNVALVIRFEREGEERFARWIGGEEGRQRNVLHRLFAEAQSVGSVERPRCRHRRRLTTAPDSALPRQRQ